MRCRPVLPLVIIALSAVACGAPPPPVAQESNPIDDALPAVEDSADGSAPAPTGPLSIDDALFLGEDAPAPWDPQHRETDRFAYDIGASQTDCAPYWEYERLNRLAGGEMMWWRDGGNLDQMVRRESEPGEAAELIDVFAELPTTCGVTSWSEGDSFTITPLALDGVGGVADVVALSIDHVRTDEVVWLAFAQRGDLISELRVTMWPEFESGEIPAFSAADFGNVAATMAARLAAAGPGVVTPTTPEVASTVPGEAPPEFSDPTSPPPELPSTLPHIDIPQLEPLPEAPSTTEPAPLVGLPVALLDDSEMPTGWTADRADEYEANNDDEEPLEGCPESIRLLDLDERFEYSTDLERTDDEDGAGWGSQLIGLVPADVDLIAIFESLLTLDGCNGTADGYSYELTVERIDIEGASAALVIGINATDEAPGSDGSDHDRYVLTLASVGAVLTAFSLPDDAPIIDLLQRAVTKIIDTGPY